MLKNLYISLLSAFLLCSSTLYAGQTVNAVKCATRPVLDGKLDDACWKKASPLTDFINETGNPAKSRTIAYVLYDDNNLYIGMKCFSKDIKKLKRSIKKGKHDASVYDDDSIEIMLDPTSSKNDYFHFIVNAAGAKFDRFCREGGLNGNPAWNGTWKAATFIGKDYWSCEMVFPFYALGITSDVKSSWGINLCQGKKTPFGENSSIAEKGAFNVAGRFAKLKGLDVNFKKYHYKVEKPIISTEIKNNLLNAEVSLEIDNQTGKTQVLKLGCWLISPDKKPQIKSNVVKIPAGKGTYKIGLFKLREQGEYDCYVSLKDTKKGNILYLSKIKIPIKYVPMAIKLIDPFYRDTIFATQNLKNVTLVVENKLDKKKLKGCSLSVELRKKNTRKAILTKLIATPQSSNKIELDVNKMPYGNLEIFAIMKDKDNKIIAEIKHKLRKLPYKKGEVWLGRDKVWRVDGKRFFPNMSWGHAEDNNPYYNVCWGFRKGKKAVIMVYYSSQINKMKKTGFDQDMIDYTMKIIKANKDNPQFFAYASLDEPDLTKKTLETIYKKISEEDPYHPVILTHNNINSIRNNHNAADLHTFHCYPNIFKNKRVNDLSKIPKFAKAFLKFAGKDFVGFLDQAFNYGDMGKVNERIHTYQEARSKMLLALICGAKGVLFYNRLYLHYPELYIGAPYLARETAYLGKAIISPDAKLKVKTNKDNVRTLLKDVNGELYLFVSNANMKPRKIKITIPGIEKYSKKLNVISEDRKVSLKGDSFTDMFDTYEVHVYTTSKEKTGLLAVKKISSIIDKINQKRKKPGNLAFQMFEGDGVELSISSTGGPYSRKENGIWHVVDGVIDKTVNYNMLMWYDGTPNKFPDWIEIKLPKKHNIGRVVVYPFDKSLKDYSVQAFVAGRWKDVDKVSGKNADMITHTFKQVNTDRIRIMVTATNGPTSKIIEVEIYQK